MKDKIQAQQFVSSILGPYGYVIGSDAKTVEMARKAVDSVNALLAQGDFSAADEMIDRLSRSMNQPFRAEFLHAVEFDEFVR